MEDLLTQLDPRFLAALPLASASLKFAVDQLRRLYPALDGGYVQAATAALALVVAIVTVLALGVYADGVSAQEAASTLVLWWMLATGAVAINEAGKKAARGMRRRKEKATQ